VNKRGQTSDVPRQSTTTLRRREFQESRRAERAEPATAKPARADIEEPAKKLREQRPRPARWALLREEVRAATQAAETLLSQATEDRAAQLKVEANVAQRERAAQRVSGEQAIHAAALLQREIDQEHLRAGGESEKQRMERQQEAEARRQREEELHVAILRKKAQRQHATATRLDEEAPRRRSPRELSLSHRFRKSASSEAKLNGSSGPQSGKSRRLRRRRVGMSGES